VHCATLAEIAANSTYLEPAENITLVLQPGHHHLDLELTISNIEGLLITSGDSTLDIPSVSMKLARFSNISWVKISGINFNQSGSITVESVEQLTIENSTFLESDETALTLINTTASIDSSAFIFNSLDVYNGPGGNEAHMFANNGGSIVVSMSSVTIQSSSFKGNCAKKGGAVYGELNSQILIIKSNFTGNEATAEGGALYAVSGCHVTITTSIFENNRAGSFGGALQFLHSTAFINHSNFSNNKANRYGGVISIVSTSTLNITDSEFYYNAAEHDYNGGVMHASESKVNITRSNFINNNQSGVIEGIDSEITVTTSTFDNNTGGVVRAQRVKLLVKRSKFTNNTANESWYGGVMWLSSTNISIVFCNFTDNTAYKGGVLEVGSTNLTLTSSKFYRNYAFWGGVLRAFRGSFVVTSGLNVLENNSGHQGIVHFMESTGILSGTIGFINNSGSFIAHYSSVTFKTSTYFIGGSPLKTNEVILYQEGGAITGFQSNIFLEGKCFLRNNHAENGGAIYTTQSKLNVLGNVYLRNNSATASGGGIYLYQSELNCLKESTLKFNGNNASQKGGGVHATSSFIKVNFNASGGLYTGSSVYFIENRAMRGGGVSLEMSSYIYILRDNTNALFNLPQPLYVVHFFDNLADLGGAVYVADETNPATCANALNRTHSTTTECFLQTLALRGKSTTQILNIQFVQNQARISGNSIFGGLLDRCTVSPFGETYEEHIFHEEDKSLIGLPQGVAYLSLVSNIRDFQQISSEPIQLHFCKDNEPDPSYQGPNTTIKAGETFSISIAAIDQVNHTVEATIRTSLLSSVSGLGEGQLIQKVTKNCTNLTFTVFSPNEEEELIMYAEGPCKDASLSQLRLPIQISACKCSIGFQRKHTTRAACECECDSALLPHITNCDTQSQTVTRERNFWITYTSRANKSGYMIHPNCPLDYCYPASANIKINLTIQGGADAQCEYDRSGKLCGTCKPGLSLSLSSPRCLPCSRYWPIVFVVIVLVALLLGIALVALLLILNLTVAAGTLNGLIFYANIANANSIIYFPHGQPNFITTFIAWLNLDLGIDVCFFDRLDAYWKTWLQLAFPAYLVFLVIAVIAISKWSTKFSQLVGKRNPVATLATLILLSYAKFLHIIIAALSFTILHYPDGSSQVVWLPDATVSYFLGKHSALFITALCILAICTVYTILIFSWQWLLYLQDKKYFRLLLRQKLSLFIEPYHVPYTPQHRYWTGLLLLARIVIYLTSAVNVSGDPSINLLVTGIVVSFLLFLKGYFGNIYKNWVIGSLEVGCYLNIVSLSFVALFLLNNDGQLLAAAYISGLTTLVLTLTVLAYHIFIEVISKTKLWKGAKDRLIHRQWDIDDEAIVELTSTQSLLTSTTVDAPPRGGSVYSEYREELLEPTQRETGNTLFTKSRSYKFDSNN
jgi:predicted outer membrane repeat protein